MNQIVFREPGLASLHPHIEAVERQRRSHIEQITSNTHDKVTRVICQGVLDILDFGFGQQTYDYSIPPLLLAFLTARTVNAVCDKGQSLQNYRLGDADALATALGIDMTKWFTPTAENFFGRISKTRIAAIMTECQFQKYLRIRADRAEFAANRATLFANGSPLHAI